MLAAAALLASVTLARPTAEEAQPVAGSLLPVLILVALPQEASIRAVVEAPTIRAVAGAVAEVVAQQLQLILLPVLALPQAPALPTLRAVKRLALV
jgi:hypothetical protein